MHAVEVARVERRTFALGCGGVHYLHPLKVRCDVKSDVVCVG